ncbi:MAG TPA: hypothetical protein VF708_20020 [Pyrinomonadaceae bacterium]|jgi:hypothetical protein
MAIPILNPAGPLAEDGLNVVANGRVIEAKVLVVASTNVDVVWSVDGGVLSNVAARSVTWTLPNITDIFVLTAKNAANLAEVKTLTVTVQAIVPPMYGFPAEVDRGKEARRFKPAVGPAEVREDTGVLEKWDLSREDQDPTEFYTFVEAWHDGNFPGRTCLLVDYQKAVTIQVEIVSKLRKKRTSTGMSWSCTVEQVS